MLATLVAVKILVVAFLVLACATVTRSAMITMTAVQISSKLAAFVSVSCWYHTCM